MMGGMNPKQMNKMMKQMGINTNELDASKVTIEMSDKLIVIENPQVTEVIMSGTKTYQIAGNVTELANIPEEDVKMVMGKANVDNETALAALKEYNGDIAEAIMSLQE